MKQLTINPNNMKQLTINPNNMKQLTINPNNRQYYSEDFIKGFECGTQRQLEADKAKMPTWIPSSKGEPSKAGWYLVTDGHRDVFFKWYSTLHGWEFADEDAILAWMPLPKPWKGADDETE